MLRRRTKPIYIEKLSKDDWMITIPGVQYEIYLSMAGMGTSERLEFIRWSILAEGKVYTVQHEKIVLRALGLKRSIWDWFWQRN